MLSAIPSDTIEHRSTLLRRESGLLAICPSSRSTKPRQAGQSAYQTVYRNFSRTPQRYVS